MGLNVLALNSWIPMLWQDDRFSVIGSLVDLAVRFDTRQSKVFTAVLEACIQLSAVGSSSTAISHIQAAKVALLTILNVDAHRLKASGGENYIIHTSVPRAHLVGRLLAMDQAVCRPMVEAIVTLDQTVLEQFAQHAEISRGVLEALVGQNSDSERFRAERRQLLRRLIPIYSTLASSMRGRFLVLKCFMAADAPTRFKIARALVTQLRKLEGTKFGREVAEELRLELFQKSHDDWANAMKPRSAKSKKAGKRKDKKKRKVDSKSADKATSKRPKGENQNEGAKSENSTKEVEGYDFLFKAIKATKK